MEAEFQYSQKHFQLYYYSIHSDIITMYKVDIAISRSLNTNRGLSLYRSLSPKSPSHSSALPYLEILCLSFNITSRVRGTRFVDVRNLNPGKLLSVVPLGEKGLKPCNLFSRDSSGVKGFRPLDLSSLGPRGVKGLNPLDLSSIRPREVYWFHLSSLRPRGVKGLRSLDLPPRRPREVNGFRSLDLFTLRPLGVSGLLRDLFPLWPLDLLGLLDLFCPRPLGVGSKFW